MAHRPYVLWADCGGRKLVSFQLPVAESGHYDTSVPDNTDRYTVCLLYLHTVATNDVNLCQVLFV